MLFSKSYCDSHNEDLQFYDAGILNRASRNARGYIFATLLIMALLDVIKTCTKTSFNKGFVEKGRDTLHIKGFGCCTRSLIIIVVIGLEIVEAVLLFITSFHSCYEDGIVKEEKGYAAGTLTIK